MSITTNEFDHFGNGTDPGSRRLAGLLHDLVGSRLALIALAARSIRKAGTDTSTLAAIEQAATAAAVDLRDIVHGLRTEEFNRPRRCLVETIRDSVGEATGSGATVVLSITGRVTEPEPRIHVLCERIVREAIANSAKHSPGSRVSIFLRFLRVLHLVIRSKRPGTTRRAARRSVGISGGRTGLFLLKEDVGMAGGAFRAHPVGSTFVIHARLPLVPDPPRSWTDDDSIEN